MKKLALATAVAGFVGLSGTAVAEPIYIDLGVDKDSSVVFPPSAPGDADSRTWDFTDLGLFPDATSVYTAAAVGNNGDQILEAGELWTFEDTGTVGVSGLVPLLYAGQTESYGTEWFLEASYVISGDAMYVGGNVDTTLVDPGDIFAAGTGMLPTFTAGTLEFKMIDASGDILGLGVGGTAKVLELDLVPPVGGVIAGDILLDGILDYSWYTPPVAAPLVGSVDWIIQNAFNFSNGDKSFYQLAGVNLLDVSWETDFNNNPNLIPFNTDFAGGTGVGNDTDPAGPASPGCVAGSLCRTTNLNMTLRFDVPVPGTLALLGLGLVGMGFRQVRRKPRAIA